MASLPSLVLARRARKTTWYANNHSEAATSAKLRGDGGSPALFDLRADTRCRVGQPCGSLYEDRCQLRGSRAGVHFWPAAARLLRDAYHRPWALHGPERLAAPLWTAMDDPRKTKAQHNQQGSTETRPGPDDSQQGTRSVPEERCWRVAVHWRTTGWSMGSRDIVKSGLTVDALTRMLLRTIYAPASARKSDPDDVPPTPRATKSCVRVALIVQYKEDAGAENRARAIVSALSAEINARSSFPHIDLQAQEFTSRSHYGRVASGTPADNADLIARDLALMATAHVLIVGSSQFSWLATGLQRSDGVHIVADQNYYVRPQRLGGDPPVAVSDHVETPCLLLPNTVLGSDLQTRAEAAVKQAQASKTARGDDVLAHFIANVHRNRHLNSKYKKLCTDYLPAAVDNNDAGRGDSKTNGEGQRAKVVAPDLTIFPTAEASALMQHFSRCSSESVALL